VTGQTLSDRLGTLRTLAWAALCLFGALLVGGLLAGVAVSDPVGAPGDRTVLALLVGASVAGTVALVAADVVFG
jgi:hypothetical protein